MIKSLKFFLIYQLLILSYFLYGQEEFNETSRKITSFESYNQLQAGSKSNIETITKLKASLPFAGVSLDDYLRVRSKSNPKGRYRGVLFKNQTFKITEISDNKTVIENESFYWFKIKKDELEGWVSGKFVKVSKNLDESIPSTYKPENTNMNWFFKRFGYSTWDYPSRVDISEFSLEEIRIMLENLKRGSEESRIALFSTFFPYWYKNPNDPKYAYITQYVFSKEYLSNFKNSNWYNPIEFLPLDKLNNENWMKEVLADLRKNSYHCPFSKRLKDGTFAKIKSEIQSLIAEKFPKCLKK